MGEVLKKHENKITHAQSCACIPGSVEIEPFLQFERQSISLEPSSYNTIVSQIYRYASAYSYNRIEKQDMGHACSYKASIGMLYRPYKYMAIGSVYIASC